MSNIKIGIVGDRFMAAKVFEAAVRERLGEAVEFVSLDLEWPDVPFHGSAGPAGSEIKEYSGDPADIAPMLADVDVLLTHLAPVTASLLAACPKLRFIGVSRGGPVNINAEAAKARGVVVSNVPGRNASTVAEFTLGAILANIHRITIGHQGMVSGVWRGDLYRYDRAGDELCDLTVGILGYSHVGQRVVRLLKPFGPRILICDPFVNLTIADEIDGVEQVDLDTLIAESDILTLHARLSAETRNIINKSRIARMKRGAVLVNTARGELVDQPALVEALASGRLGGAALDTYAVEPPAPDDPLLSLPNVTLTPHIAGASRRVVKYAAGVLADDLARYLRREPVLNACA